MAGVFAPDAGTIHLAGRDFTAWASTGGRRWIGRVFQDPLAGTAPHLTVEQNLAMALLRGARRAAWAAGVTEARRAVFREDLARLGLGLENRLERAPGLLSGGQRQALTLLMATLQARAAAARRAYRRARPGHRRHDRPSDGPADRRRT